MVKLSIVIPTRCRQDTLQHTLRSILSQDYDSFEVIVSDNFSDDETSTYVNSISDSRLRYINTGRRISMSENWDFALSHCQGDYVTIIGDDDGFTPQGVSIAMAHLERSGLPALIWEKAEYSWPDHVNAAIRNTCSLRISGFGENVVKASQVLSSVCRFKTGYSKLPCIYNGIISRQLMNKLAAGTATKRLYGGICPDVYSSIVLGAAIPHYVMLKYPVSVNGASRHSNGTAQMRSTKTKVENAAEKFLKELDTRYPEQIQWGPSVSICIMGEHLLAREAFPGLDFPAPDYRAYLRALAKESLYSSQSMEICESAQHTAQAMNLPSVKMQHPKPQTERRAATGVHKGILHCRFDPELVSNVYDACQAVGAITLSAAEIDQYLLPRKQARRTIASRVTKTYNKALRFLKVSMPRVFSDSKSRAA